MVTPFEREVFACFYKNLMSKNLTINGRKYGKKYGVDGEEGRLPR